MLKFFHRNSCIHSTAATIKVFEQMGFRARALPVAWNVVNPATQKQFVSGLPAAEKARGKAISKGWVDLTDPQGNGWDGHMVAIIEDQWWIDASFDQAGDPIGATIPNEVFAFKFGQEHGPAEQIVPTFDLLLDDGTKLKVQYLPRPDNDGYLTSEAWTDEAIPVVAQRIVLAMQGIQVSDDLVMFAVYEGPTDFPAWKYVVRRWLMDRVTRQFVPDRQEWAKFKTNQELNRMREEFIQAGRIKMNEPPDTVPRILEVWL
jgi:hypothetical protein